MQVLILQAVKALHNKKFGRMRPFSTYIATANGSWILPVYKQASHLLPASRHSCTHTNFVWNLTHISFSIVWIVNFRKILLKLRTDHSGKFVPREINPLYGSRNLQGLSLLWHLSYLLLFPPKVGIKSYIIILLVFLLFQLHMMVTNY